MENRKFCPIEEAILRIEASAKNNRDLLNTLYFLQRAISSVLAHPNDWRTRNFEKENEMFIHQLFNWTEVRQFLELIGFREDCFYERGICDEGMRCLEAALRILNTHIHKLKIASIEEKPFFESWKDYHYLRNQSPLASTTEHQGEKMMDSKSRCAKLQEMLSRHLKQERLNTASSWKKSEVSDASFNSEGYFHQTSQKKDKRKRKCYFEEMFDRHDFNNNKKGCAFFPYLKLG